MRYLISRLSALGDTVCSLPAAVALKSSFPECHITWVVDPRFATVVRCCEAIDEVIPFKPKIGAVPRYSSGFDAALDLQGLLKSAIPVFFARAKRKVGYHWQREGSSLFSERILPDPSSFHVVDQYVDVARALGAEANRAEFRLEPKQEDVLSARAKLKGIGQSGRFVVMNGGAGWATKRWPTSHFAKLIDDISSEIPTVLVGGSGQADQDVAAEILSLSKSSPFSLVGNTSIGELIALIRLSTAHVGGDTGSSHIAAAMDVPAIGLYSITRPARSCPYGQIERCHYDASGLANIQPEAVSETVRSAL